MKYEQDQHVKVLGQLTHNMKIKEARGTQI